MSEVKTDVNAETQDETTTAINLIDDVSKNLETLKKLVGIKKKTIKKKKEQSEQEKKEKSEKLPKYVYMKEGIWYKKNVHESIKTNLKKYILESMLH